MQVLANKDSEERKKINLFIQNFIEVNSMSQSRKRQFNQYRSHNPSIVDGNQGQISKLSQSTVSEACVNCVNCIIAERQKKAEKDEKERAKGEYKKAFKFMNQWVDQNQMLRESMKKDALNYNQKEIEAHKMAKKHEKEEDFKYAMSTKKNIEESQQLLRQQYQTSKERKQKYYKEVQKNYLIQCQKKVKQKYYKQNNKDKNNNSLPLFNADTSKQKLQYRKDLQQQMKEKKKKLTDQKINTQKRQKQLIDEYNIEAQKYHADHYQAATMSKEEVFDGLTNLELSRKKKAQQKKKANDEERMKLIKQQNEDKSRIAKQKMKEMKNYVQGLKKQLKQKQERLKTSKREQINFVQIIPKSTQEIQAQNLLRKTCKHCHKNYPQQFIGRVPKKV